MALDTIDTPVSHVVVQQYLARLDARGESYSFDVTPTPQPGKSIRLILNREGCEDALELRLDLEGKWSASHVIVIGEKE